VRLRRLYARTLVDAHALGAYSAGRLYLCLPPVGWPLWVKYGIGLREVLLGEETKGVRHQSRITRSPQEGGSTHGPHSPYFSLFIYSILYSFLVCCEIL